VRQWLLRLWLLGLGAVTPLAAQADRLRICVSDHAYPPLTFPHRDGQAQYLIRRAVGEVGWQLEFVVLPWRRCLKAVTQGDLDGAATVADTAENRSKLAMPLRRGMAHAARSVGEVVAVVIRRRDSQTEWNGKVFSALRTPVIHEAGISAFSERLAELGYRGLDSAHSPEQLMRMLLMGRADVALGLEPRVSELLRQPEFAGLQRLPLPFMRSNTYLAFNKALYAEQREHLDRIWVAIERIRHSAEWPELARTIYPGRLHTPGVAGDRQEP
jgi:polar amino acid transport system substrate-binding protein